MRILHDTASIQREVADLMRPGARRVAIVAFVGAGAEAYIPRPKGVTIVCWPKAGGTNPNAIRELMRRKADVWFADKLHMKLFWAEQRGAVIGSANLTTNALGAGGLKELAVRVPAESVNVDKLLISVKPRKPSKAALDRLEFEHRKLGAKLTGRGRPISFLTWFDSKVRSSWKLGWWDSSVSFSEQARAKAHAEYNRRPLDSIWGYRNEHNDYDWILSFCLTEKRVYKPRWLFVDFVVPSGRKGDEYSFEAVQVRTPRECPMPPFALTKQFNRAFARACREYGFQNLQDLKSSKPPKNWLRIICQSMEGLGDATKDRNPL